MTVYVSTKMTVIIATALIIAAIGASTWLIAYKIKMARLQQMNDMVELAKMIK